MVWMVWGFDSLLAESEIGFPTPIRGQTIRKNTGKLTGWPIHIHKKRTTQPEPRTMDFGKSSFQTRQYPEPWASKSPPLNIHKTQAIITGFSSREVVIRAPTFSLWTFRQLRSAAFSADTQAIIWVNYFTNLKLAVVRGRFPHEPPFGVNSV